MTVSVNVVLTNSSPFPRLRLSAFRAPEKVPSSKQSLKSAYLDVVELVLGVPCKSDSEAHQLWNGLAKSRSTFNATQAELLTSQLPTTETRWSRSCVMLNG